MQGTEGMSKAVEPPYLDQFIQGMEAKCVDIGTLLGRLKGLNVRFYGEQPENPGLVDEISGPGHEGRMRSISDTLRAQINVIEEEVTSLERAL